MNLSLRKQFPRKTPIAIIDWNCKMVRKKSHGVARAKLRDELRKELNNEFSWNSIHIEG